MTQLSTNTHLPVPKIIPACEKTLAEISVDRKGILLDIVKQQLKAGVGIFTRTSKLLADLSPEEKAIAKEHRRQDEKVCRAIMGLSKAAARDNLDFRAVVSASDFAVIEKHYL